MSKLTEDARQAFAAFMLTRTDRRYGLEIITDMEAAGLFDRLTSLGDGETQHVKADDPYYNLGGAIEDIEHAPIGDGCYVCDAVSMRTLKRVEKQLALSHKPAAAACEHEFCRWHRQSVYHHWNRACNLCGFEENGDSGPDARAPDEPTPEAGGVRQQVAERLKAHYSPWLTASDHAWDNEAGHLLAAFPLTGRLTREQMIQAAANARNKYRGSHADGEWLAYMVDAILSAQGE